MNSVYRINKGVGRAIEFRGLRAQYIGYLAVGLLALLLLFVLLYAVKVNVWLCLVVVFAFGTTLFVRVFAMSRKYGEHGLMKKKAQHYLPWLLRFRTRSEFLSLRKGS